MPQSSGLITVSILFLFFYSWDGFAVQPTNAAFKCGDAITDVRDGQVYPTVMIGIQCWIAKNLNIGEMVWDFYQDNNGIIEKTCYQNDPANCDIYGGLYRWDEAMGWSSEEGSQGICPQGWQLPTRSDWDQLRRFLGYVDAGQQVKVDAEHDPSWDGNNSSGFSALPAGVGHESYFGRKGHWSLFWTSTEADEDYAWFAQLDRHWYPAPEKYKIIYLGDHFRKTNGFSVRCIKNNYHEP